MSTPLAQPTADVVVEELPAPLSPSPAPSPNGNIPPADVPAPSSVDWPLRQRPAVKRFLNWLEGLSLALETPIVRLVRQPQFNPLYHTGTIALFALLVILVTGVYLTMFYPFGFQESYQAVARIEANLVGRWMRALHRYASALAVIAALLHGWRTLFMDRFRGPRWLAWTTGIVMAVLLWGAGLTGYWLIFDERAQLFNQALIDLLDGFRGGVVFLNQFLLTEAAGQGWLFVLGVLTAHLVLSVIIVGLFVVHIVRLRRAKILPPRYWMAALFGLLAVAALLVPVGMLPPADPSRLPAQVPLDVFLLFYFPAMLHLPPGLFWSGVLLITTAAAAVPWLLARKPLPPVQVHADRCTGCTLCAADCPYKAIQMVERHDDSRHKYLAVVDPKRCVACGICIGSCTPLALTLGDRPAEPLWQETLAAARRGQERPVRLMFVCERHAAHGARRFLPPAYRPIFGEAAGWQEAAERDGMHLEVIPLPCIGMAQPDLATQALAAGAAEVQFVGCPPEDCANREGNLWLQERLDRRRLPKLRRQFVGAPIATDWLAPNDTQQAVAASQHQPLATAYSFKMDAGGWRAMVPALALLALTLVLTIPLTSVPYRPSVSQGAVVRIELRHRSGMPLVAGAQDLVVQAMPDLSDAGPQRLVVEVDGQVVRDKTYGGDPAEPLQALEQVRLDPGQHRIRVLLFDRVGQSEPQVLLDRAVALEAGQVLALQFKDARLAADPEAGRRLFMGTTLGTSTGCVICHSLEPGRKLVGPSLAGVATRAETAVPGLTAEEYLRQSIVEPNAHVVEGYPPNQMPPTFAETLTEQQISDLVAFLMTLK
ncbi:MAG: cytochrome b N-terminal domain-containing protein [Caldilineales bacterium]|nr:cytochrome b N-terminal domain-containing protein [Caldilineales bacterium]